MDITCAMGNADENFLYLPKKIRLSLPEYKYNYIGDLERDKNSVYAIATSYVKNNSKVFDVGCSTGYLGKYLKKEKSCKMYGVDIDSKALDKAIKDGYYTKLLNVDLDNDKERKQILSEGFNNFDYILCLDVLEHLKNINDVLFFFLGLLKNKGSVIVSIPNVAHIDIVYNLILGNFNYSPWGILDNTHLRFFTKNSFIDWIKKIEEDSEYKLEVKLIGKTYYENINTGNISDKEKIKLLKLLEKIYKTTNMQEDMFTLQYVFLIKKEEI